MHVVCGSAGPVGKLVSRSEGEALMWDSASLSEHFTITGVRATSSVVLFIVLYVSDALPHVAGFVSIQVVLGAFVHFLIHLTKEFLQRRCKCPYR